jgi:glycine amidinotransferase
MSLVDVHNEWDPLEEMIVGTAAGARVPRPDRGLFAVEYREQHAGPEHIPSGPFDQRVVEEANEDLEGFVALLEQAGVTVRRPATIDHAAVVRTPDWSTDGGYDYCPRDILLPVGRTIIETPMVLRSRSCETLAYKDLLLTYFESGANWIAAPKPRLLDETYDLDPPDGVALRDLEPVFDAANVLRLGRDLLYLVSSSGNMLGCRWLERVLGDGYRVHPIRGVYPGTHIDTTVTPVRPGLVVLNPDRMSKEQVPGVIKGWDVIWPDMVDTGYGGDHPLASIWQGMNFIMVNPSLAVVNDAQIPLIRALEAHGVDVVGLPMRHARTLSGGFHCVSLDVRRRGTLEDYS